MIDFDLLKLLSETPGAPGFESRIRKTIKNEITDLVDEVKIDAMGNLVGIKKGIQNKRVAIAAHMDEISFIVSHIDEDGFVRFQPLGGFDPKTLTSQRVILHGKRDILGVMGSKPIHIMKGEEKNKAPKMEDYYIDCGFKKVSELKEIIKVGDFITRERSLEIIGNCVNGKSLDNRISVYILIETLKQLKNTQIPYDLYAIFSVQEEVGLRGAMGASSWINPDFGIGLDVTIAYDSPNAQPHENVTRLGEGTAIKILDGSTICDSRMVSFMQTRADKHGIKWQPEILPAGGTDTAALQRYGSGGSIAGAISIPLRHMHTSIEMVNMEDVNHSIALLTNTIEYLDKHDWDLN